MTPDEARAVETLLRLQSLTLDRDVQRGTITQHEATELLASYHADLVRVVEQYRP